MILQTRGYQIIEDVDPDTLSYVVPTNDNLNDKGFSDTGRIAGASPIVLIYLPGLIMHEFGHTIRLEDLYEHAGDREGYLMNDDFYPSSIPDEDEDYVEQVYRNRHGARPH